MKLFRTVSLLLVCSLLSAAAFAVEVNATPVPKGKGKNKNERKEHGPGLLDKLWSKIVPAKKAPASTAPSDAVERQIGSKKVMLSMALDPQPLKLSDTRQLKVTLFVANRTKKMVQLEFPTTQRIEVLIRNSVGKLVEQWSEDRTFANDPGMVSINPGERLEYSASLSTRDLSAGQSYTVEAFFPSYEALRLQRPLAAEK